MASSSDAKSVSPVLVAIAALVLPGLGYWIMGQRSRGLTVGIAILSLFILGVLVGGIRIVDPPGYGEYGYHYMLVEYRDQQRNGTIIDHIVRVDPSNEANEADPLLQRMDPGQGRVIGWALPKQPIVELGEKPWFVGQILCGPISLVMSALAISEAHPVNPTAVPPVSKVQPSHSRSWEIGTLYTAVAGMLNLLAIIDSSYRSAQTEEKA